MMLKHLTTGAVAAACMVGMCAAAQEGYSPIAYIQSSGTQWIDTGYYPNPTTRMEADIQFVGDPANRTMEPQGPSPFGCSENNGLSYFGINFGGPSSTLDNWIFTWFDISYDQGGNSSHRLITTTEQRMARALFRTDATSDKASFGTQEFTVSKKTTTHAQASLALFGFNTGGNTLPFTYYGLRVYGWKIWDGETLVHDLQPVLRVDDRTAGLLDSVTGYFYENAGEGKFLYEGKELVVKETALPALMFRQQAITPELTALDAASGNILTRDVDYRLDYADNDKPGLATVTAVGLGDYSASSVARTFRIVQPECYCPIAYIQSSGTQWIDTGYYPNPTTRMEADIQLVGNPANRAMKPQGSCPFGCLEDDGSSYFLNFGENYDTQDNDIYAWFDKPYGKGGVVRKLVVTTEERQARMLFRTDATSDKAYFGTREFTVSKKTTTHTKAPLALFGINTGGNTLPFTYYGLRVYGWKIWDGNTLVHDFQPVMRADDLAVGLLDRVTGLLHENAGTGTFARGLPLAPEGLPPEYQAVSGLISDGGAWVDTGVKATSNTTTTVVCVPYYPYDGEGAGQRIISARTTAGTAVTADELLYEVYANGSRMLSCACSDGPGDAEATTDGLWSASGKRYDANARWSVTLDSWGNAFYVNGAKCVKLGRPRAATSPANIALFSGGSGDRKASGAIERAYVWERGLLVRNFVPCCRAADGVAGLYDLVGGAFYPSAGSSPFRHTLGTDQGVASFTALYWNACCSAETIYANLTNFSFTTWVRNIDAGPFGWYNTGTKEQEYYGSVLGQGALGGGAGFNCFVINYTVQRVRQLIVQLRNAAGKTTDVKFDLGSTYLDGKWHHIAFTCDRNVGEARLYFDGQEKANCTDAEAILDTTGGTRGFVIGSRVESYPVKGDIAQVTLWNRAIAPAEILRLRGHPATGREEGLLGWWPLDCGDAGLKDGVNNGATPHDLVVKTYMGFLPGEVQWSQGGMLLLVK